MGRHGWHSVGVTLRLNDLFWSRLLFYLKNNCCEFLKNGSELFGSRQLRLRMTRGALVKFELGGPILVQKFG